MYLSHIYIYILTYFTYATHISSFTRPKEGNKSRRAIGGYDDKDERKKRKRREKKYIYGIPFVCKVSTLIKFLICTCT